MRTRVDGPFAAFGAVAGLLAGSLFLPDGCAIHAGESLRLRAGLPIVGPIVFLVAARLVWRCSPRFAASGSTAPRRDWTLLASAAIVLGAMVAIACSASALYAGDKLFNVAAVGLVPVAFVMLLPVDGVAIVALPLVVRATALGAAALPGSRVSSAARAARWALVAAAAQVSLAGSAIRPSPPDLDPRLYAAATAFGLVLVAVGVHAAWQARRRATSVASARAADTPDGPYRTAPAVEASDSSSAEARVVARLRRMTLVALAVAVIGLCAAMLIRRSSTSTLRQSSSFTRDSCGDGSASTSGGHSSSTCPSRPLEAAYAS